MPKIAAEIHAVIDRYPAEAVERFREMRELLYRAAEESGLPRPEEALKWGEPAYQVKGGTTVRIDWKEKSPDRIAVFFNCRTRLIVTLATLYADDFVFEGNRAMYIDLNQSLPVDALKCAFLMALRYHSVKHLPLLGA